MHLSYMLKWHNTEFSVYCEQAYLQKCFPLADIFCIAESLVPGCTLRQGFWGKSKILAKSLLYHFPGFFVMVPPPHSFYRDLYSFDKSRDLAVKTFLEHRASMHPVTSMLVGKDLKQDQWQMYWFLWDFCVAERRDWLPKLLIRVLDYKMLCCFGTYVTQN